jgi:uncharacterized protein (TIGR02453 family)
MITKTTFSFFKDLKANNNRDWFQANKARYEAAHSEFLGYVTHLIAAMIQSDPGISGLNPKDTIFRIYRDVRFSKDKSPYKTHMGAYLVKGGKKSGNAGYYVHLEPGGCFAAGGVWQPSPDRLRMLRNEIFDNIDEFKAILDDPGFKETFPELMGDRLTNPPKGFPGDHPDIDLLKYKNYAVGRNLSDQQLLGEGSIKEVAGMFKLMVPFIGFINNAFEHS